jgi:hypothetical protein
LLTALADASLGPAARVRCSERFDIVAVAHLWRSVLATT